MDIFLRELTERSDAHGSEEGKLVYDKLLNIVNQNPATSIFRISLDGIEMTDASFPRESVVAIAKQFRDEGKYFLITGTVNNDLIDNWNYAALARQQPLVLWSKNIHRFLGPEPSTGLKDTLSTVFKKQEVTTPEIAELTGVSTPNASSKLKKLAILGYIYRAERTAETGGIEYVYRHIK